jgi:hypothetical protein
MANILLAISKYILTEDEAAASGVKKMMSANNEDLS